MFGGNNSPEDEAMFLVEKHCFVDLQEGLMSSCVCGMTQKLWILKSIVQVLYAEPASELVLFFLYFRMKMWSEGVPVREE